ncbi:MULTISPECIES: putative quinol monooxygenase [Cyanophyceae]|uniref:putative quinol monooxygenase n=1 Tax=Cyanophyceae TaxID=3028117 RepID=UPI0016843C1A|nr:MULTISPECIES: putative quinol monooxygenase [Cyanophyceae]MBD1918331.1 antibiotic biosynthesis monooxygenase [Phormidium sp. FACHB-77]MBD2028800.1 antibiotic biosynthesis monooxygenase [Phormidium sp. FACHB-322]MBD2051221.1 antibiotic biosynthesis monooxygenase [Leptolyngbya sp. FACHB-60]
MISLTIIAKIKAKLGVEARVREALIRLIPPTLAEAGCLNYDLHRSIEDPTLFAFYENWESESSWQQHIDSKHVKAFQSDTGGLITVFEVLLMQPDK